MLGNPGWICGTNSGSCIVQQLERWPIMYAAVHPKARMQPRKWWMSRTLIHRTPPVHSSVVPQVTGKRQTTETSVGVLDCPQVSELEGWAEASGTTYLSLCSSIANWRERESGEGGLGWFGFLARLFYYFAGDGTWPRSVHARQMLCLDYISSSN